MADENVTENNGEGNGNTARVDVSGAIGFIKKADSRLSLLVETMFKDGIPGYYGDVENPALRGYYEARIGQLSEGVYGILGAARMELQELNGLLYPEEAPTWAVERAKKKDIVCWDGCDLSGGIALTSSVLGFLIAEIFENISGVADLSRSAFLGVKVVIEDVRNNLHRMLADLEECRRSVLCNLGE